MLSERQGLDRRGGGVKCQVWICAQSEAKRWWASGCQGLDRRGGGMKSQLRQFALAKCMIRKPIDKLTGLDFGPDVVAVLRARLK